MKKRFSQLITIVSMLGIVLVISGCGGSTKRIDVDADPVTLAMDHRGKYLFIGCSGGQTVISWDLKKGERVATVKVDSGEQRLYFNQGNQKIILLNKAQKKAVIMSGPNLDVEKEQVLTGIPSAWYEDEMRKINYYAIPESNEIQSIFNGHVMPVIQIGLAPQDVLKQPDSNYLWAANYKANEVAIVNLDSSLIVKRIHVWSNPYRMAMAPYDEKLYVLCAGKDVIPSKSVIQLINLNYQTAGLTWSVGKNAVDMKVDPKGRFVFVIGDEGLMVISIDTGVKLKTIKTNSQPSAMVVSPDGGYVYVACRDDHAVYRYKIDRKKLLEQ